MQPRTTDGLGWLLRGAGLATWVAMALGANCGPKLIKAITPTDGEVVTTFSFAIEVELGGAADPSTLEVVLNGQDITGQLAGGPPLYSATIDPGAPLLDDNTLEVSVKRPDPLQPGAHVTRSFQYLPPKARAAVVANAAECPSGPLAHCTVGDVLLSNSDARFVIQKPNQRDLHFTGTYGGNLIDAEPVVGGVPQGNDNFFEFQPMLNVESVVNATSVEIVNDGQDGTPAIIRSCGPDDLLDDINPSSVVLDLTGVFPPGVDDQDYDMEACTEYRLEPQTRVVEVVTTIENMTGGDLSLYVGDYINAAGELEQWTPIQSGLNNAGVGELFVTTAIQAMAFYGFDQAEGRDYALIFPLPPESPLASSSFTQSGVSAVLWGHFIPAVLGTSAPPNFLVPAASPASFRRWFSVGDGSGGNTISAFSALQSLPRGTLKGCVTSGGNPLPGARVLAGLVNTGGNLRQVRSHWVTGADGCYEGVVPAATYRVAAAKEGYPYEGGGATPALHVVTVADGGTVVQDVTLPGTGRLHVAVVDHASAPVPARVGVVGFDPSPELIFTGTVPGGIAVSSNAFYDVNADPVPAGLTRTEYTDSGGVVEFDLEPGSYQVAVSRGTEWSLFTQNVTITAGTTTNVNAQIAQVLDTPGFISSDYHVHMVDSPDSRISRRNRIQSFAGEGVDNLIATDHAYVTNLMPEIAALGFGPFLHSTPGEEITTFDYGHFNAYPQGPDPGRIQTRGSTDHSGAAPPGEDFPSFGNYNLSPAQIEAAVLSDPDNAGLETAVQVNHIDSHFDPLRIDTSLTPPASVLDPGDFDPGSGLPTAANPLFFRLDPSIPNFFHAFPALELWNGMTIGHQNEFLVDRIGIWMNLLNQGIETTAIADTDTHEYHNLRSGGARTWTPSSTDAPAAIVDQEIGLAVKAGKAVGGQGLYVQTRLLATDGSGGEADFDDEPTLVSVSNGEVQLEIRVQAPAWAPYDRIEIYRNASTQVAQTNGGTPTLFTAVPTSVLSAGTDFTVNVVPVNGASRLETLKTLTFSGLAQDAWIAVVVKGTQGVSPPMFPVQPSNLSLAENPTLTDLTTQTATEAGIRALGFTNALYVDVDGNASFDPPGVSVVP